MKNSTLIVFAALTAAVTTMLLIPVLLGAGEAPAAAVRAVKLTHQQEVWIYALEWCESNGDSLAINKKDRDGTPSYGAYQFKPSTLYYYARKYGVLGPKEDEPDHMLYGLQRAVVKEMVLHRDEINWNKQFPVCVQKLGKPPAGVQLKGAK